MRLRRQPVRPHHETIIALIDVVFFLLVFFMLVGRMDATSPFELSPPISVGGDSLPAGGATVSVSVDGRLALDGVEQTRIDLVETLEAAVRRSDAPLLVRINAHAEAPVRHLLQLVTALEGLAKAEIVLVVTPNAT
ncbi:biopolymer transporter ExbD [Pelagibius sp. Alg239-R121]|uniref:ExbD/TolR family protein n=1 Tax=Pelagibius sp. Alg239-R121 TaxID=2993448 RepID=UPI0024A6555D|nr:biopolymer transporter ExbD [Pelagibius sp. Alg239-R121]